jgi:hypothetical protein
MLVCIAIISMMLFGNVATAATAPADTVDAEAGTVQIIKDFLEAINEVQLELDIGEDEVVFRTLVFSYADAGFDQVLLAGTFTDWVGVPMVKRGNTWTLNIAVPNSSQYYRFSVTDEGETWKAIDPDHAQAINHKEFGWVSVLEPGQQVDTRDSDARKERRRKRRDHQSLVRTELELGQGVVEDVSYQRVDGLVVNPAVTRINEIDEYDISVRLHGNYGFSSGRFGGGLTIIKPILRPYLLNVKLSLFDRTMPNNFSTGVGNVENSLAAFFLHEDYRDYHRSKGINASLVFKLGQWFRLEGGIRKEDHASLGTPSIWSAKDGGFPTNPLIDEGRLSSVFFNLGIGGRNSHIMGTYERSGENVIGGDFEFERITAKLRGRLELGSHSGFDARLAAGSNFRGSLPAQKRFLLGGLGTVRGYAYQSLMVRDPDDVSVPGQADIYGGEQSFLGNLEYYFTLIDDLQMSVFYDAGMVWQDRHAEPDLDQLKTSAGISFKFDTDEGPRIDLIQVLDDREDPYVVQFRLKRSF